MRDYEDFYNELSEFDERIERLKKALMKAVREEYVEKMNQLQAENKKLQGIKEHFEQVKRDYENKKRQCETTMRQADQNARRMRANEVMENFKLICWTPITDRAYGPKCEKCNRSREVAIELPSGKKVDDYCQCKGNEMRIEVPRKVILHEIADRDSKVVAWYKPCGEERDRYYYLDYACSIYSEGKFVGPETDFSELVNDGRLLFKDRDLCLAYCKYINDKNGIPEGIKYTLDGSVFKMDA